MALVCCSVDDSPNEMGQPDADKSDEIAQPVAEKPGEPDSIRQVRRSTMGAKAVTTNTIQLE